MTMVYCEIAASKSAAEEQSEAAELGDGVAGEEYSNQAPEDVAQGRG